MAESEDEPLSRPPEPQDAEFWSELNQSSPSIATKQAQRRVYNESPDHYLNSLSNWSRYKLHEQMDFIQKAQAEELVSQRIQVRNKTRKDFKNHIDQLQEKFEGDVNHLMQDYDELKVILSKRDKEIQQLIKHISEQETLVNQYHITRRKAHLKSKISNDLKNLSPSVEPESCESLVHKIELMEDIVTLYKKDVDELKAKYNLVEDESIRQKTAHEAQKEKILAEDQRKKEMHDARMEQLRNEFEEYKKSVEQEIELRQVIEARQLSMIEVLKQELKSAKTVIQNPRLRSKVQTRLKIEKQSPNKDRKNSTPPPSNHYYIRKMSAKADPSRRVKSNYRENILVSAADDREVYKLRDSTSSNPETSAGFASVLGLPASWKFKETSSSRFRNSPVNMM